jgi:hypothetical protein
LGELGRDVLYSELVPKVYSYPLILVEMYAISDLDGIAKLTKE